MFSSRWDFERAVTASTLPPPSRLILLTLATRADSDTGVIPAAYSPSHARLATDTGLSRRTVIDHLAALETARWVKVKRAPVARQRAEHAPNTYRLMIPTGARTAPETSPEPAPELVQELHPEPPKASAAPAPPPIEASATAAPGRVQEMHRGSATAAHVPDQVLTTTTKAAAAATRTSAQTPAHERTRARLAELSANAVKHPDGLALVLAWERQLPDPLRPAVRAALAKQIDTLLTDLGTRANLPTLRAALDDWATRGRTPGFLAHCYDDATQRARAALTSQDVPGSRVQPPAGGRPPLSKRAAKALSYLAPDDPLRAEFGMPVAAPVQDSPPAVAGFNPLIIEGGRSA